MNPGPRGLSRRAFVLAGTAVLLSAKSGRAQPGGLTARQVVDRIRAGVGVPWRETTVDTFKAGDPDTLVTGIATTAMATLGVLRKAAASGRNLIVTHEPTFYAGNDLPGARAADPVYLAKKAFIDEHRLVVWRFSDHWLARKPNELTTALAETLGWTAARSPDHEAIFTIPATSLRSTAAHVRSRLGVQGGMRVIGKADSSIRRVVLSPGTTSLLSTVETLPQADLIVSGEPREWEAVEYVFDTAFAGQPKCMIAVGRIVSEEPGMRACAAWLRTLVREVPVEAIPVGDPYLEARAVTAAQIVARIQQRLAAQGIAWRAEGRDAFKAGDPETEVRGIATTGMSTFDLLRRASAKGRNFVITHEPTFYNDRDLTTGLEADPVYLAKQRFIAENKMTVWRFHDHAHAIRPDPLIAGSARALGWTQYASPSDPRLYVIPATTLRVLAADIARRLNDHGLRVVGDPDMKVTRIALGPGYGMPVLTADVDVSVGGEIGESGGNAEYALDAAAAGQPKAMIVLGHMMSEDHGMQEVAEWLRTFLDGIPVEFIAAGEPFAAFPDQSA